MGKSIPMERALCIKGVPSFGLPKIRTWVGRSFLPTLFSAGPVIDPGKYSDAFFLEDSSQPVEGFADTVDARFHDKTVRGLNRRGKRKQQ